MEPRKCSGRDALTGQSITVTFDTTILSVEPCADASAEWIAPGFIDIQVNGYAGVDYNSPRAEIAKRVASRSTLEAHQLETLMRRCEETINGASINWKQAIDLVRRLRQVEQALGLRMRSREVRQATRL